MAPDASSIRVAAELAGSPLQIAIHKLSTTFRVSSTMPSLFDSYKVEADDWTSVVQNVDAILGKINRLIILFSQLSSEICGAIHPDRCGIRLFTGQLLVDCRLIPTGLAEVGALFVLIHGALASVPRPFLPSWETAAPIDPEAWKEHFSSSATSCGICAEVWLESVPPLVGCSNCSASFHDSCCREWMLVDPTSKRIFSRLSGKCPACDADLEISSLPPTIARPPGMHAC